MKFYSWLALALSVCACGDSNESPAADDASIRADAGVGDPAPSASRDGGGDATLPSRPSDARVGTVPAQDAATDAAAPVDIDAQLTDARTPSEQVDARTSNDEADAALDAADVAAPDGGIIPLDPDTGVPGDNDAGWTVDTDAGPPACNASAAPVVGKLGLQVVVSGNGLASLTEATQPPGQNDWYLVEQRGRIMVFHDGALQAEPFLDVSSQIFLSPTAVYDDRGLFSIAFAPDYATSGLFYISLTPNQGANSNIDYVLEYKRSTDNPYRADPEPTRVIVELRGSRIGSPGSPVAEIVNIHNGGRVTFGPDGKLYLAMGDGGGINCGDTEPNATQDVGTLFGKLLRLDLSQPAPYGALDNPFVVGGDARVLHYGLRNPFRYSFDRATGDLYLGDVGQNTYEEVDFAPAGAKGLNFGWASFEANSGSICTRPLREGSTHTPPIFVADRTASATSPFSDYNAVIGGVVYRGKALPQLNGVYFFGGYRGARLGALYQCGETTSPVTPVTKSCNPNTPSESCLRSLPGTPGFSELRAIVEDHDGEMYVVANGNSLLKVVPNQ